MSTVLAIDPGTTESAYARWDGENIIETAKKENSVILGWLPTTTDNYLIVEKVECYGMPVGADIFETVYWSGRFIDRWDVTRHNFFDRVPRREVKLHLCNSARAKDANIIAAIVDRFDPDRRFGKYGKGVKKNPGPLFGFSKDVWQALALALTWWDQEIIMTEKLRR